MENNSDDMRKNMDESNTLYVIIEAYELSDRYKNLQIYFENEAPKTELIYAQFII